MPCNLLHKNLPIYGSKPNYLVLLNFMIYIHYIVNHIYITVRRTSNNIGIMFLVEAALGKEHHIKQDDWTLKAAPKGYDSIVAKGRTEPGKIETAWIKHNLQYMYYIVNGFDIGTHTSSHTTMLFNTSTDPKNNTTIEMEGNDVVVPQGKPINQPKFSDS